MDKNLNICFFISSMHGGGAQRVLSILANEFSKRDYRVDLILAQKKGPYLKDISNRVNIVDLRTSSIIKSILPLVGYFRKDKPDILTSALHHANIAAIIAKIISRTPVKLLIRQDSYYKLPANLKQALPEKTLYKKADYIIAVSEGVADSLINTLKIPKEKIKVIYNPIFDKSITEKAKQKVFHPFFQDKRYQIILGVGRLARVKDFPTLIKAFHSIKTDSMRLMILGEGRERKELENLVQELGLEEYVSMPGFVENPYAYLAKASVFVLSSKCEGLPNVLIEAMACGTTVVSTDCPGGPYEILEGGKYGKLVPVGDIAKLAEAISDSLKTPTEKELLISRAKYFSVERAINEYEKLFKELIKRDNSNNRCQNV